MGYSTLSDNLKSNLHLHLIVFIWGFSAILGNLISLEALALVWYRIVIATLVLLIYFILKRKSIKMTNKVLFKFFLVGFIIAIR